MATPEQQHWNLESLNKAYQQGYMAGMTDQSVQAQPYTDEIPAAAWEGGWDDGHEQFLLHASSKSA